MVLQVPPDRIRDQASKALLGPPLWPAPGQAAADAPAAAAGGGGGPGAVRLRHAVVPEAVDPAYLHALFPSLKAVFKPQVVKYR